MLKRFAVVAVLCAIPAFADEFDPETVVDDHILPGLPRLPAYVLRPPAVEAASQQGRPSARACPPEDTAPYQLRRAGYQGAGDAQKDLLRHPKRAGASRPRWLPQHDEDLSQARHPVSGLSAHRLGVAGACRPRCPGHPALTGSTCAPQPQ